MLVMELGKVIEVSPVQPLKALLPMLDTELGIDIEDNPVQPLKVA